MSFPLILLFDTFKRTRVDAWCVRVSSVLHHRHRCLHTSRSYMTVLLLRPRNAKRLASVDKVNHSLHCCLHDSFPLPPRTALVGTLTNTPKSILSPCRFSSLCSFAPTLSSFAPNLSSFAPVLSSFAPILTRLASTPSWQLLLSPCQIVAVSI